MTERFVVTWTTSVEAADPEEAALIAFRKMQDRNTTETVMAVMDMNAKLTTVDTEDIPR